MRAPGEISNGAPRKRGYSYNAGFLTQRRVRRILQLAGYDLRLGKPGPDDDVLVWGHSPYAGRGTRVAGATGAHLVRIEDAFLRSLHPGRSGDPPMGLIIDRRGIYFDASGPSDLEVLLSTHPLDDTALLDRARGAMARIAAAHLTKYAANDPDLEPPPPGYVLLIDQTRGDAAIRMGAASAHSFAEMLAHAMEDHPGAPIVIKTHPETRAGHRAGHFDPAALPQGVTIDDRPIPPQRLFEGARAVYCVSSLLGFEAILAGHRPVLFGVPFYAGWGLSDDRRPTPARRQRKLTRAQLAAAALILYPTWYDPYHDRLGRIEDVLGALEAEVRAWRADRAGYVAVGMRAWKRRHLTQFFGPMRFTDDTTTAAADGRAVMVWAGRETPALVAACADAKRPLHRLEDGFLRSRGLGAELVPPLSLVVDDLGIYYDPSRESRLDRLIAAATKMEPKQLLRAEELVARLVALGVTKYNPGGAAPEVPLAGERPLILVPGQVEDDASIILGAGEVRTNAGLLARARPLPRGADPLQTAPRCRGRPAPRGGRGRCTGPMRRCGAGAGRSGDLAGAGRWCGHDDLGAGVRGAVARRAGHLPWRALLCGLGADPRSGASARASQSPPQPCGARPCGAHHLSALFQPDQRPALPTRSGVGPAR